MASDCAVHFCGETAEDLKLFATAAEAEVRRIEARYSRYRGDSELARINKVAATGGVIAIDEGRYSRYRGDSELARINKVAATGGVSDIDEARYSRYRGDSELARINKVAATGGVIDID